jgi:hypothetical protein
MFPSNGSLRSTAQLRQKRLYSSVQPLSTKNIKFHRSIVLFEQVIFTQKPSLGKKKIGKNESKR